MSWTGVYKGAFGVLMAAMAVGVSHAATISVTGNTFNDELNSDGDCSLREAVQSANSNTAVDGCTAGESGVTDVIRVQRGTYILSLNGSEAGDASTNDLDVTESLEIQPVGGDATNTRIEPAEGYTGRAFEVEGGASRLTIKDLAISGFDTGGGASGGAIFVAGAELVLERVLLEHNKANASGAVGTSGADRVIIRDSALVDNTATHSSFGGGALGFNSNEIELTNVTLLRNHTAGNGGAISINSPGHALSMDNVTMVGNTAAGDGGGLHISADSDIAIRNSIITGNRVAGEGSECALTDGLTLTGDQDYNLWSTGGNCFASAGGNSVETDAPHLGMGGHYDGSTTMLPLLSGSPAIDAGSCQNSGGGDISTDADQRAGAATRNTDGNGDGSEGCDIGAVERQRVAIRVDSVEDTDDALLGDGTCADSEGRCTLRAAIDETNATPGLDEILLEAGEYVLTKAGNDEDGNASGDLDVRDSVILIGSGASNTVIDADGLDRALHVPSMGLGQQRTLALHDLAIRNGDNVSPDSASSYKKQGGGVYVRGKSNEQSQLLAGRVHFYDNRAGDATSNSTIDGGAISVISGRLRLVRSTVNGNEAERSGSGLYLGGGARGWIQATIISGNSAGNGDAVFLGEDSRVHLERVTIADNEGFSTAVGGSGTFSAHNSIIGVGGSDPCDFYASGKLVSLGHNLDETSDCALSEPTDLSNATADLASLSSSGAEVPLRTPLKTSHAVGTGSCQTARGYILPPVVFDGTSPQDAAGFGNGHGDGSYGCDIGAVERQSLAVTLGGNSPDDREMALPSEEVVVAQFTLANEAGEPLRGSVVTLSTSGTGDESSDITEANLYVDNNADGALDANDTLVDSVTSLDDDGEIRFEFSGSEPAVPSGGDLQLIVTYRFSDSLASVGTGDRGMVVLYGGSGLGLFALAAFAPLRRRGILALFTLVALTGCGGGGDNDSGNGNGNGDDTGDTVSRTYSLELESLSVEGDNGGTLRIRTESVAANTLTVTDQ